MSRMGRIGYLADGTAVQISPAGGANMISPPINAGVPGGSGGGLVQGRGLVFQYQTPVITSLANGASTLVTIQFDQNSVFNWLRSTVEVNLSTDTYETMSRPMVTLQISDTGNGMSFMNTPVPLSAIAGTGQLPYVLPTPQLIQSNASYQFAFANYSGTGSTATTYYNLRFTMHGFRIFNPGS